MTSNRKCDACGGYGWDFSDPKQYMANRCFVCSGRGWQSDAMPVSDAIADAETLWFTVLEDVPRARIDRRINAKRSSRAVPEIERDLYMAQSDGNLVGQVAHLIDVSEQAIHAARAAFRAVPGLRG